MITRSLLHERITFISLLLIAFTLPFHILLCSYSIAIFVINQLAEGNILSRLKMAFKKPMVLMFAGFFLLHVIGLAYTQQMNNGLFELEKKVSLLIFPLLLCSIKITADQLIKVLATFVIACFLLSLFFLGNAFHSYIDTGDPDSFLLDQLSAATGMHRVYASMYFLFCIFILVFFRKKRVAYKKYVRPASAVMIVYFTGIVFMLSSRIIVGLTIVSLLMIILYNMIQTREVVKGLGILTLFLLLSGSFLFLNERVKTIMIQTYTDLDKGNSEANFTGPNMRIEIWKAALQVAKENYFSGVGTGDAIGELHNRYIANDFRWGMEFKFNAHNQYLQTLVELGIMGLFFFIACIIWPAYIALRKKHLLYLGFLFLFSAACLTESMLAAQKGIVFYAFFNALLTFHYPKENT